VAFALRCITRVILGCDRMTLLSYGRQKVKPKRVKRVR
jgi:negative regulator of replication initiation